MFVDYYEILGVAPGATSEEIKEAYRRRVREAHPELHPEGSGNQEEEMRLINEAYQILRDPRKRAAYEVEWKSYYRWKGALRRGAGFEDSTREAYRSKNLAEDYTGGFSKTEEVLIVILAILLLVLFLVIVVKVHRRIVERRSSRVVEKLEQQEKGEVEVYCMKEGGKVILVMSPWEVEDPC